MKPLTDETIGMRSLQSIFVNRIFSLYFQVICTLHCTALVSYFFARYTTSTTLSSPSPAQALLHKLLSLDSPPDAIYVLVREKRGVDSATRVQNLLKGDIFESLWGDDEARKVDLHGRVRCVVGDITEPGLGLSEAARAQLASEVSVVFHSAATVKFDDALTRSVAMNVEGSRSMLQLAKEMPRLRSYVHVSTAYCHCQRTAEQTIEERFYPVGGEYDADQVRGEQPESMFNAPIALGLPVNAAWKIGTSTNKRCTKKA